MVSNCSPGNRCGSTDHHEENLWLICVCVQDKTTRWCLSLQRKIIIGFFIIVFLLLLFTKSCEECMFKPFSCYILTVTWNLSNHPLVTVRKGCLLWFHSCIWSESNKTNLDVKIPYLLTFNTQLLFQSKSRTGGFPGGTHPKNKGTGQGWDSSWILPG